MEEIHILSYFLKKKNILVGVVDSDVQLFATFAPSDLYIDKTLASFYIGGFHRCSVQRFSLIFAPPFPEFLSLLDTPGEGCEAFSSGGRGYLSPQKAHVPGGPNGRNELFT